MWIYHMHALRIEPYVRWKGELENFTACLRWRRCHFLLNAVLPLIALFLLLLQHYEPSTWLRKYSGVALSASSRTCQQHSACW
jgi:hypothetical protein